MNKDLSNTSCFLPKFSSIKLNDIKKTIQNKITSCYNTIDQVISKKYIATWNELHDPLMIVENELQQVWSPIMHLNSVKHDLDLRKIYSESLLSVLEYKNWVMHNYGLYKSYQKLYDSNIYDFLNLTQKKALGKILLNYELSGIHLSSDKKKRYTYIVSRLSQLSINYTNNVLDATLGWKKLILNKNLLSGLPDNKLKIAQLEAQSNNQTGWLFTLQYPSCSSILLYCDNSELREEFYWAFRTRSSDQGPNKGKWDNTPIIDEILSLRYELARLLGFNSYFERSLKTKMARYPQQVFSFLMNLVSHSGLNANKEFLAMKKFAKKYFSQTCLKPWDIEYYKEKQKQHLFSVTEKELCSYFPEDQVLYGMFTIANLVYGITIKKRNDVDTWHSDVQFFDIFDEKNQYIGGFYLDLYIRNNKYEGAWMDVYVDMMSSKIDNTIYQRPIVYLTCNFDPPKDLKTPCLLTHDNIITLFHEFGHVLHHILISTDIPSVSGVHGMPEDCVEIPSQFMEKFCWEPNVLQLISMHYKNKQSLPNSIINDLLKIRTYQSSCTMLRQVIYGLFDLKVHDNYDVLTGVQVSQIFNKLTQDILMYHPIVDWERLPCSFVHIFSDNYAAGYYSYLWSDMLASDIWLDLQKLGVLNIRSGTFFLKKMFYLNVSSNLEKYFIQIFDHIVTTQPILKYYNISIANNIFFKLV